MPGFHEILFPLDIALKSAGGPERKTEIVALGSGDGTQTELPLLKTYGGAYAPCQRPIARPVAGSVRVAVGGVEQTESVAFTCDAATGIVTFLPGHVPGAAVCAGFLFDVPVRF